MALPKKRAAAGAWDDLLAMRADIIAQTEAVRRAAQRGDGRPQLFVGYHNFLVGISARWNAVKDVPGMAQFVRDEMGDQAFDVVAGYNGVSTAGAAVVTWLRANMIGQGNYLAQWELSGQEFQTITYSAASMAALVPLLDDLLTAAG